MAWSIVKSKQEYNFVRLQDHDEYLWGDLWRYLWLNHSLSVLLVVVSHVDIILSRFSKYLRCSNCRVKIRFHGDVLHMTIPMLSNLFDLNVIIIYEDNVILVLVTNPGRNNPFYNRTSDHGLGQDA